MRLLFKLPERISGGIFSESLGYVSGADAAGADLDTFDGTLTNGLYFLQVRVPGATGFIVGMTYVVPEAWTFATNFTYFRH